RLGDGVGDDEQREDQTRRDGRGSRPTSGGNPALKLSPEGDSHRPLPWSVTRPTPAARAGVRAGRLWCRGNPVVVRAFACAVHGGRLCCAAPRHRSSKALSPPTRKIAHGAAMKLIDRHILATFTPPFVF